MYAVRANPVAHVLDKIYEADIRHFDTASLAEIELIRGRYPDSTCHFMAPVRIPGEAGAPGGPDGLSDFVGHFDPGLGKVLAQNQGGKDPRLFFPLAPPFGRGLLALCHK